MLHHRRLAWCRLHFRRGRRSPGPSDCDRTTADGNLRFPLDSGPQPEKDVATEVYEVDVPTTAGCQQPGVVCGARAPQGREMGDQRARGMSYGATPSVRRETETGVEVDPAQPRRGRSPMASASPRRRHQLARRLTERCSRATQHGQHGPRSEADRLTLKPPIRPRGWTP
jgi:hypothetical protein